MRTQPSSCPFNVTTRSLSSLLCPNTGGLPKWLFGTVFLMAAWSLARLSAPAQPVSLTPIQSGGVFGFQFTGASNAIYRVQSSTDLTQSNAWVTEDVVTAQESLPTTWMAPEFMQQAKYYRLALPQPEITDIEPAVAVAGLPVTLYIIGQGFGSNDVLRIGPTALTNRIVVSPTLIQVTFTPDVPGTYDFELDSAATGKKSTYTYSWTLVSAPAGSQALLEPPSLPPAAPVTLKQKNIEDAVGQMRDYEKEPANLEVPNLVISCAEVQVNAVDMVIPGRGLDFVWARTYRSRTGATTAMGNGWDFSCNVSVQKLGGDILIHGGQGRDDALHPQTNGTYLADGFFRLGTLSNNVFRLTFADTGFWEFNPFDGSATAGKLARSVDRNGNTMSFSYDSSGRLNIIIDDLNRTNTLAYNSVGQLQSITDFSGRTVTYSYYPGGTPGGSAGDLASVTTPPVTNTPNGNDFPTGKTTTFTYTTGFSDDRLNHNLASITDPKLQTWFQVFYHTNTNPADLDFDAVDYIERGPYLTKLRRYAQTPSPANQYATVKAICNDGVGDVTECFFDARNRCVRQLEYTGRANPALPTTETDNRPIGKLRASDPDYFETRWEWNPDSLCTREIPPDGITAECVYSRSFVQNNTRDSLTRRQAGDLRVVHQYASTPVDLDGDGFPDIALRAAYFDYAPGFGSAERVKVKFYWDRDGKNDDGGACMEPFSVLRERDRSRARAQAAALVRGWDPKQKHAIAGSDREVHDMCGDGRSDFAIRATDFNHNVTTATYDASGNRLVLTHQGRLLDGSDSPVTGFAYNAYGQLTACTNPPDAGSYRRVDTFTYYSSGPQAGYCYTWTVDTQGPTLIQTTFEYDSHGNMTRCIDARGNDRLCTYNALDQCVRYQTPTNLTARCVTDFYFDANDNLVQKTVEVRDQADAKYSSKFDVWSFDILDRCTTHVEQVSDLHFLTNSLAYDGDDNVVTVFSPEAVNGHDPTNLLLFAYDERNLLFQSVHAPSSQAPGTNQYDYDAGGRCITITVAKCGNNPPAITLRSYDGFGRPAMVTDPMSNACVRAHDANDNLVYQRFDGETNDVPGGASNRRLAEARYEYDSLDRCTREHHYFFDVFTELPISKGDSITTYAYAPNGQCSSVTDDNNHTTRYTYNTVGRLLTIADPKTNMLTYSYDALGNPLSATSTELSDLGGQPQVFVTYDTYDNLNRCISSSDNVGNTNRYAYDSLGRCVRCIDARGNLSGRSFDLLGRCTMAIADLDQDGVLDFAKDAGTTWSWDDNSRCLSSTDANSNSTFYAYDSLDRCILITNPDATTRSLIWSPRSNLVGEHDPNSTVVSNSFDLLDRCTRRDIAPGSGVATTTTFEVYAYDGLSRLVLASNSSSTCSFAFNSLGQCLRSSQDGLPTSYTYDGVGNELSMTYPSGRVVSYTYDALDQVTSLATPLSLGTPPLTLSSYSYDGPARLARVARANGINTRVFWDGLVSPPNFTADFGWRQVSAVNHQVAGGGATIDRRSYAFDRSQNKALRAQLLPWGPGGALETNSLAYDSLDRLRLAINTKGSTAHRHDYTLDAQGNRLAVTNDGSAGIYARDPTTPEPADFQMDQYTMTPSAAQQYDHNGNLVLRNSALGFTQYHYDYADRLVEVDGFSGGAFGPLASFTYDALGRRISKTTYPPSPLAPVTTTFIQDCDDHDPKRHHPGLVLEERVSNTVSRLYCWGRCDTAIADLDRDGWPDVVAFNASGQPQYYHGDELGNVLALTDAKGNVLERYSYDDYGLPSFYTADGVTIVDTNGLPITASMQGNPLLFQSMYWDNETGFYCREYGTAKEQLEQKPRNRTAYFDPAAGRYLLRAGVPLRFDAGANSYTFAGENPWSSHGGVTVTFEHGDVHRPYITSIYRQDFGPVQPIKRDRMAAAGVRWTRDALKGTTKTQGDFNLAHRFSVEIDGVVVAGVHSIEGLKHEHEVIEYKDGEDGTMHTRPGNHKPGKMTVTKDWSNTSEWYNWRKTVLDGKTERKSISVIFHNDAGAESGRYNFYECWPSKWKGPSLNARNSGHATEKIELSWERMELK
jgi:phage tail-like protein